MRTITIELRVDYDTKEKEDIIMIAAKRAANHLWTQALLIKDKRQPQIALMSGDMFTATEEIAMSEGLDDEVPEEPVEQGSLDV